jgi:hypothetical protein
MEFTARYFYDKFNNIPAKQWTILSIGIPENLECTAPRCALGHSNVISDGQGGWIGSPESSALVKLFGGRRDNDWSVVYSINDSAKTGGGARKKILAKLKSLL